ncbi:hypothetical protein LTR56_022083 [Elasticomyces elasticus]|nr:hypothetical protein LTR56_022083 [Elasticomyces elasticus]KAK3629587.1 hypothetical protein LTR22_021864 [Elasticomyces elasticus]KAK4919717.1 hypothetical protein LTR49_012620 [Elasticomyces elasticus]KAK5758462.1 hypothetical protein LTS12_011484 [Elasticomyces elasticus]
MSEKYQPPAGPPPNRSTNQHHVQFAGSPPSGRSEIASNYPFRNAHASSSQGQHPSESDAPPAYEAPPGPPPSWHSEKKQQPDSEYLPPPGPPPSHMNKTKEYIAPPGPPPSHSAASEPEPPPYDPWMSVPDNALLPPPPSIKDARSPTANATWDDAARAHAWTNQNPLWRPQQHSPQTFTRIASGRIGLTAPPNTKNIHLEANLGGATVQTSPKCSDTIFLSDLPLYTAQTGTPKKIYFELKVVSMGHIDRNTGESNAGIAIGFLAPPYPAWRLPGWERSSIGVHGDDGRRYVDDSEGGIDFVSAFRAGDVVGIGMMLSPPQFAGGKSGAEVFFTRNGKKEGGFNLHEERDSAEEGGDVTGLEGRNDILAAVGCFGGVEFEVRFRKEEWKFRP